MFELSPAVLGALLLVLGLGFVAATLIALRVAPRPGPAARTSALPPPSGAIPVHHEAVLLVESGGLVSYINQAARELFNVWEQEPNLESLARRTRPSEDFLMLCAGEGQTRFSLNGRFVEGKSYYTPGFSQNGQETQRGMLITLHRPQPVLEDGPALSGGLPGAEGGTPEAQVPAALSPQALQIFTGLSQAMASSLDLKETLLIILESVERLLPSDFLEIVIWDTDEEYLVPYRLFGLPGIDRRLEIASERYRADTGYAGYLISRREPLLVQDINTFRVVRPALDRQRYPYQSYLGVPLLAAGNLIGALELASLSKENYNQADLEALRLLSGQAAIALNNALLYQQERRRTTELAGLANLAQSVSALRDPQDLYARLVESISPLLPVEILGFLVYDENRRLLHGQTPFLGILDSVIEWYQMTIEPESRAEEFLHSSQPIFTEDATQDARLQLLDLHHLAQAAGFRRLVLQPLASGGHNLGFLLAARKKDASAFDPGDLRVLAIIAGQIAPIIENANLVQQSRRRTQRAETLRRVASLTGSTATLDEILKYSLLDLARLLQADAALIFTLDERHGELRLHTGSLFGVPADVSARLDKIPIDSPGFQNTAAASGKPFQAADVFQADEASPIYRILASDMQLRSVIDVPLLARERGIGELLVGSLKPDFFQQGDLQTIVTAAGQLAAAIEQAALSSQTDESLRLRAGRLTTLTRLSRELNRTTDLNFVLQRIFDEALKTTQADCGAIRLFALKDAATPGAEPPEPPPVLASAGDEPGAPLHPLEIAVVRQGETRVVEDFNDPQGDATFLPPHPGIRSALLLPLTYQGQVAGLIHLHAGKAGHFSGPEVEAGEALATQAAMILGNALRYRDQVQRSQQLTRRVETLSSLLEVTQALQSDQPLENALERIAHAIRASTSYTAVLISLYCPENDQVERVACSGISPERMAELRQRPQPWPGVLRLLDPKFQTGRSFFISNEESQPPAGEHAWHANDLLLTPFFSSTGEPLGLISLDAPLDGLRPDRLTLETLEIFSSQAGLIVENQLEVHSLKEQVSRVKGELEAALEASRQAQSQISGLQRKALEQTLAIQQSDRQARRIQAGLDIAGLLSIQSSPEALFARLSQEMITRMGFDAILVAKPTSGGLSLIHSSGAIPPEANPKALLGQKNPLRHSLQNREPLLVSNLSESKEWQNTPLLRALETDGFVCLPIPGTAGEIQDFENPTLETRAALLAVVQTPIAPFTPDDERLFILLARQVAAALNNLDFLEMTSRRLREVNLLLDFSQQLGSLDPESILRTLVSSAMKAVPAAQTAMVVLWDAKRGALIPQAASGYPGEIELVTVAYQPGEGLPGQVYQRRRAVNLDEVDFAAHYNLGPENLLHYRNATGGRLPVSSLAVPIMAGAIRSESQAETGRQAYPNEPGAQADESRAGPLGVLVLDSAQTTGAFTEDDLAILVSLAQQTALTLENARLYQASEQRSKQLQALTDASTRLTASLERETLVSRLLDHLRNLLAYDTGTLWLRYKERGADRMKIYAARGFEDSDQRLGLTVDVEDSRLMDEMIRTGKPIWVPNVKHDARFQTLSRAEALDGEVAAALQEEMEAAAAGFEHLSWLGVPLISSGQVAGVVALEKAEPDFYTEDDIQVAATFAAQAAAGLDNAALYQESVARARALDEQSQSLSALNRLSAELSGTLNADLILSYTTREFHQLIPCTSATALLYFELAPEPGGESSNAGKGFYTLQAEYPPQQLDGAHFLPGAILSDNPLFERVKESLGIFSTDDVASEPELAALGALLEERQTRSLLIAPVASGGEGDGLESGRRFHGLLLVHNRQVYRYEADELELARTICNQAATALQNARLFGETRSLSEHLELRVQQRTAELEHEQQRSETLLRIITELSASLDLNQVLNRTLSVLGEYVDAEQIVILIDRPGQSELQRISFIERKNDASPKEKAAAEQAASQSAALHLEQILGDWIVRHRQSILVDDVKTDERWRRSLTEQAPANPDHSALGVPLMSGAEALGCLLLFHSSEGVFSPEQLDLVQAAANQVAISVNNAELYRLIRDQAEDLGAILRNQQIETSRSKAILEAVADGVLVTDANRQITLFNRSAEKILGLERSQVLGKSMEHFAGIFGRATQRWQERINTWSHDPISYQPGDTYSEQITLEDERVISVHLAPVTLRSDFLGTVSIFQDISHQVEVDRLKSEFVATVSHELRTPMTSIRGYVEILLMGAAGPLSDQQTHFLQVVKSNTERLGVLVNDLLDVSQIESGKVILSKRPLSLEAIADQAIKDLQRRILGAERTVTISKEIQPDLPLALADAERIRRIFDNLLDNSYQYNLPDGRIIVRIKQVNDELQVDVKDTGVGINLVDNEQVFERFFRGENPLVLGVAGTGLGLSIVKNLVQMHDGRIWMESAGVPGEGSTFSFTIPVYHPKAP